MKNFSSRYPFLNPKQPNSSIVIPEAGQQEKEEEEEEEERKQKGRESPDNDEEEKSRCEWDFNLSTVISSLAASGTAGSDAIGVIEFDPSDSFMVTGGIARKIRIYSVKSLLNNEDRGGGGDGVVFLENAAACDYYICTPAKLSSLRWKPWSASRIMGSGDYDGVVMEYDLEKRLPIFERDEHGGRRVWSIDYSHSDPTLGVSGSDDGTMQVWDPRCGDGGNCLAAVQPNKEASNKYPVCCVEFNPFGGPLLTVGCADRKVYIYDVRKMVDPVIILAGHQKTVTYTRFLDSQTIFSSSIDGCLMMWNTEDQRPVKVYKGHVNNRRFVGLSVWRNGGLLSCGSENNQVFVYDKRWGEPIWVHGFEPEAETRCEPGFVSSVCWRQPGQERCTMVAGGSDGVLQVFVGERK